MRRERKKERERWRGERRRGGEREKKAKGERIKKRNLRKLISVLRGVIAIEIFLKIRPFFFDAFILKKKEEI